MKKSPPSSADKQYSNNESIENASNDSINLSNEFNIDSINENNKIQKNQQSYLNQSKDSSTQNESISDGFWDKEFDPAIESFLKSISKESNMEIDALNDVIQELKKLKNPDQSSLIDQSQGILNNESFDSNSFIDKFNACFHVSTSSIDEVMDMIEMIQTRKRRSQNSKSKSSAFQSISPIQSKNKYEQNSYSPKQTPGQYKHNQYSPQQTKNQYEQNSYSPKDKNYYYNPNYQIGKKTGKANNVEFNIPLDSDDSSDEIAPIQPKGSFHNVSDNLSQKYYSQQSPSPNANLNQSPYNPLPSYSKNSDKQYNIKSNQKYAQPVNPKPNEYSSYNDYSSTTYTTNTSNPTNSSTSDIDFLREKLNRLEIENKKYKEQVKVQEEKINSLAKNNEKLTQSKNRVNLAFEELKKLIKEQVDNSNQLKSQRDSLVSLLQKQSIAFQELEKRYEDFRQEIVIERLSNGQGKSRQTPVKPKNKEEDSIDKKYSSKKINSNLFDGQVSHDQLLDELQKISKEFIDNMPEEISSEIEKIRDNSVMPIQSRINGIISLVCKQFKMTLQENEVMQQKTAQATDDFTKSEASKSKVINFLENELLFLQKITESSELQNIVFYKPELGHSLQLDPESRNTLLQRCLNAHKFIDKNVGFYSSEQNEKLVKSFNNLVDPNTIFSLNQPEEFENKMKNLLKLIEDKSEDIKDNSFSLFYDVLFSQSIMNDILQRHASYLQSQLQFSIRQNQLSDQQLTSFNTVTKNYKESQNLLSMLQKKEKKICEMVLSHFPDLSSKNSSNSSSEKDEDLTDNLYLVVKALIDRFKKQSDEIDEFNKDVENKLKEAKKILCARLEKSNKKIKILKQHLSSLKEEILQKEEKYRKGENHKEAAVRTRAIPRIENRQIDQLQSIQNQLLELKKFKLIIRKSIINLRDQFMTQIDQFRENTQNAIGISANYKKLSEKNQKTIAQLVKDKENLKNKINQANQNFDQNVDKFENMISQLKSHISSLEEELNQTKLENSKITNSRNSIQNHNNHLRSQLDALNVNNRNLEIKLNSAFDNFDNEKRELNIQFEAKLNSLQSDLDSKVKEEQSKNLEFIRCLYKMASKYLNPEVFNKNDVISPETVIRSLSALIDDLNNKQDQYYAVLNDLQKVHSILNIDQNSLVSSKVEQLVSELIDNKRLVSDYQSELSQFQKKCLFLSNENNSITNVSSQIKQWERWARRVCSIASSAICTTYSTAQLQNSLEEFILSSLEQRPLMYRIQTLRLEKKYFLKFPKSILTETISYAHLNSKARIPSFRAVVIVYLGVRRIQKAAGLLPVGYEQHSMKKILDNDDK